MLFTSDPKVAPSSSRLVTHTDNLLQALQYILNTSAYNFIKTPEVRAATTLSTGKGLVWADGCPLSYHNQLFPAYSSSFNRDATFASEKDHESRVLVRLTSSLSSPLPLHCSESTKAHSLMISHLIYAYADRNKIEGACESNWTVIRCRRYLVLACPYDLGCHWHR